MYVLGLGVVRKPGGRPLSELHVGGVGIHEALVGFGLLCHFRQQILATKCRDEEKGHVDTTDEYQ